MTPFEHERIVARLYAPEAESILRDIEFSQECMLKNRRPFPSKRLLVGLEHLRALKQQCVPLPLFRAEVARKLREFNRIQRWLVAEERAENERFFRRQRRKDLAVYGGWAIWIGGWVIWAYLTNGVAFAVGLLIGHVLGALLGIALGVGFGALHTWWRRRA